jgi:hypothetical protein
MTVQASTQTLRMPGATIVYDVRGPLPGTIARQCLELGLLDAVAVDLVPVVMGRGRPFFNGLSVEDAPLGDPTVRIQGDRMAATSCAAQPTLDGVLGEVLSDGEPS